MKQLKFWAITVVAALLAVALMTHIKQDQDDQKFIDYQNSRIDSLEHENADLQLQVNWYSHSWNESLED